MLVSSLPSWSQIRARRPRVDTPLRPLYPTATALRLEGINMKMNNTANGSNDETEKQTMISVQFLATSQYCLCFLAFFKKLL